MNDDTDGQGINFDKKMMEANNPPGEEILSITDDGLVPAGLPPGYSDKVMTYDEAVAELERQAKEFEETEKRRRGEGFEKALQDE